jgi:hypothetical protein
MNKVLEAEKKAVERITGKKLFNKEGFKCLHCGRIEVKKGIMGFNSTPYINDLCDVGVKEYHERFLKGLK